MNKKEVFDKFKTRIPISKTIIKDCVALELRDNTRILEFWLRDRFHNLNDDCKACYLALANRKEKRIIVLDNRSLLITLMDYFESKGIKKEYIMGDQLKARQLDPNSSQWSTAKVLRGLKVDDYRYHVEIGRQVLKRWENILRINK